MISALIGQSLFGSQRVTRSELRSASWSAALHGAALGAWYFIRPVRDEIGSHHNAVLTPMTTATFAVMLVVMPLYAWIVKHATRRQLVPGVYGFFAATLVFFWASLRNAPAGTHVWIERAFYVWASVFNLFLVSVLWGLFADVFTQAQGKRLFGYIAAGGSLGGIVGSAAASMVLVPPGALAWMKMSRSSMLLVAAAALVVSTLAVRGVRVAPSIESQPQPAPPPDETPIRGTVWQALLAPFQSAYLFGICAYLFLYALTSTFLSFHQSHIVAAAISDRGSRAALFARMDLIVNTVTLLAQLFLASRAMLRLGVAITLCITPALTIAGFVLLAAAPVLMVVVSFQVARRIANFAMARPAREVLFTIVPRQDKYKAKTFIDTFIYRGGDTVSSWAYSGLEWLGLRLTGVAMAAAVFSAGWLAVAGVLGRSHQRAIREMEASAPPAPPPRGFEVVQPQQAVK
jgi:AAA family ATP:ADP antiporter